jgi:hypothetical protein
LSALPHVGAVRAVPLRTRSRFQSERVGGVTRDSVLHSISVHESRVSTAVTW